MTTSLYQYGVIFQDGSNQTTASAGPNRNMIINGAMRIDQRNAGAYTDNIAGESYNTIDRFYSYGTVAGKFRMDQVEFSSGGTVPRDFKHYLTIYSLSAYLMPTNHHYNVSQRISLDYTKQLGWGTSTPMGANAGKAATLSFWVLTYFAGEYSGSIQNAFNGTTISATSFPFKFTTTAGSTWQKITIVIPPPSQYSTGWDQPIGMIVNFSMGATGTYAVANAAANAWTNSEVYYVNKTSGLPPVGTTSDGISITGLQLEAGGVANEYEITDIGTELAECQRYYRKVLASTRAYSALTNTAPTTVVSFSSMRAIPTATIVAGTRTNAVVSVVIADESSAGHRCGSTAAGTTVAEGDIILLSAEL